MAEVLRYPVAWFKNVFDTEPKTELLTLRELDAVLTRFEVKPQVLKRLQRELDRVDSVARNWARGQVGAGRRSTKVREAVRRAQSRGEDESAALAAALEAMRADARRGTKKELRLWSPALFAPGGRRDSDHVLAMSCLVLDYDDGTEIADALSVWGRWHFIAHTTWSHTDVHHKFRVVFPLAQLAHPVDWPQIYDWAEERAIGVIDRSKRGIATTFALPTVANRDWPRLAYRNVGELLNPVGLGLVPPRDPISIPEIEVDAVHIAVGDPGSHYIEHLAPPPPGLASRELVVESVLDDDTVWSGGAISLHRPERHAGEEPALADAIGQSAPSSEAADGPLGAISEVEAVSLDRGLVRVAAEVLSSPGVRAEVTAQARRRLFALYHEGSLSEDELEAAIERCGFEPGPDRR